MDSFFGIGLPELLLILIIAGVVMGPERIGRTARWLGKVSAQLRSISHGFMQQLNAELDSSGSGEIKEAWADVQELQRQLKEIRNELTSVAKNTTQETRQTLEKTRQEVERSIAPPGLNGKKAASTKEESNHEPIKEPPQLPQRLEIPDDPE